MVEGTTGSVVKEWDEEAGQEADAETIQKELGKFQVILRSLYQLYISQLNWTNMETTKTRVTS